MEELYTNSAKRRMLAGEKLTGCWIQTDNTIATEILSNCGFDLLLIDCEHGPTEITRLISHFQAMNGTNCMPMVRAPWNDLVSIKRILDCGAMGIHIPYVNTYEEALNAVKACKYPPEGFRGIAGSPRGNSYGGLKKNQYQQRANQEILVVVAIETPQAVEELDKMLTIEGLDGIFIGPMDLATTMGYFGNPKHPEVQKKIAEIEEKVFRNGTKLLGTVGGSPETANSLFEKGYSYVIMGSDERYVRQGALNELKALKELRK